MNKRPDTKLVLNQPVPLGAAPDAVVVGVDRYRFTGCDGRDHHWESYTLTSSAAPPYDRFWIANVPDHGGYLFTAAQAPRPDNAMLREGLSGFCQLDSTGDASLSTPFSALNTWQEADGTIHSVEVFNDGSVLRFLGLPFLESVTDA